jgi:hypothetical protein
MEEEMTTMSKRERTIAPTSRWRLRAAAAGAVMATVALAGVDQLGAQQPSGRTITFGVTLFDGLKNVSSLRSASSMSERASRTWRGRSRRRCLRWRPTSWLSLASRWPWKYAEWIVDRRSGRARSGGPWRDSSGSAHP